MKLIIRKNNITAISNGITFKYSIEGRDGLFHASNLYGSNAAIFDHFKIKDPEKYVCNLLKRDPIYNGIFPWCQSRDEVIAIFNSFLHLYHDEPTIF